MSISTICICTLAYITVNDRNSMQALYTQTRSDRSALYIKHLLLEKILINSKNFGLLSTVELQWLEHLWDHENIFERGVVRGNEG